MERNATSNSGAQGGLLYPSFFAELCKRARSSIRLVDDEIESEIVELHLRRRPSDIARFVISIVIDSIKRVLRRRSPPNIGQKCRVAVAPFLADCDPTASVVPVIRDGLVIATRAHSRPSAVFLSFPALAMLDLGRSNIGGPKAATALGIASAECAGKYDLGSAAITQAVPSHESAFVVLIRKYQQSTKSFSAQVFCFHVPILN